MTQEQEDEEWNWETSEAHSWLDNTESVYQAFENLREKRPIKGYDCKRIAENHLGDRFGDERGLSVNNSRIQWGKIAQVQNDSIYKEPCARCGKETVYWTRSNVDEQIVCRACDQAERCIQEPTFEAVELPAEELSEYERGYEQGYDDARYTDD